MALRKLTPLLVIALTVAHGHAWAAKPANVLVIVNDSSQASREIGAYYVAKRKIPAKNVLHIKCPTDEYMHDVQYPDLLEKPVKQYLAKTGLNKSVDYLVTTKGVPVRLRGGKSVDGLLMCMDFGLDFVNVKRGIPNPYYGKNEHFSHKKYGFYLATRLDGYTVKDAKALVDRSLAARPAGAFLLDMTPSRNAGGYRRTNLEMEKAHQTITKKGYLSFLDDTSGFVGGRKNLMGYFSWGSNDPEFDVGKYKSNQFVPGAIGDTAVSTSARTFNRTKEAGQSLIADLIESGITGVKGYVAEPTLAAISNPEILFDRYLSGFNLAESFHMASRLIFWRDIAIGDPLCAPYAKSKK
jgi:uncharacterized protein (TIGR03790 family)